MKREPPTLPHPTLERRPPASFGWLDARLLHQGWLELLGPEAVAVQSLLAIAADHHGASFYRRETMALRLSMQREALDWSLKRLQELGLLAHRPWQPGMIDGVWQLLPLPDQRP